MRLLKWIYKLLCTLSFFILIGLAPIIAYFVYHPEDIEPLLQVQQMEVKGKYSEDEAESIGIMGMREEKSNVRKNISKDFSAGQEYLMDGERSKITIKTTTGYAFLRPSQIVGIRSGKPSHTISTIQGESIEVHHRKYSLQRLYEELSPYSCFFQMKQSVINCRYVQQIEEKMGVHKVILENGMTVPLPDNQVDRLLRTLEGI